MTKKSIVYTMQTIKENKSSGNGKLPNSGTYTHASGTKDSTSMQTKGSTPIHTVFDLRAVCWSEIIPSYWTPSGFRIRQSAFLIIELTAEMHRYYFL